MRRAYLFIVPLGFALLAGFLVILNSAFRSGEKLRSQARLLPYRLEDVIAAPITPGLPFFVADVDLDGNDDLLINEATRLLWYRLRGKEMILAGEAAYECPGSTRMVADANGDGRPEFFVFVETPEGWMLYCHDWFSPKGPSAPLYVIGPLLPTLKAREKALIRINFLGSFPAEKGAHPDIFIGINSRRRPEAASRALVAYDGVTGQERWRFGFGPFSSELKGGDFGASGRRLLLTTQAVKSGVSYGGTTDSISYVLCLEPRDGRLLWKKEVCGIPGRCLLALADINGDGQNEILIARSTRKNDPIFLDGTPLWTAAALSGEGEVLHIVSLGILASMICVNDLDGRPPPEVLVHGRDGQLVILNNDFTVRRVSSDYHGSFAFSTRSLLFGVRDLDDEGNPEIVCRFDSLLVVRDHEGTPIVERALVREFDAQLARYDGRNHIVAASDDSIHVMVMERMPVAALLRTHARHLTIAMLAAAIVGGVGSFHIRRRLKRGQERRITFDAAQNDLLTAMSAFGHGGSSLKMIDRIRLHLKNWERVQSDTAARDELFARLHATFMETVMPELGHIVMLAHKAGVPEQTWSTIMPRVRLAGQATGAIVAAGPDESAISRNEHIEEALTALADVDESIAGIRSYLRSVFRTPFAEAIEKAIARFREENEGMRISLVLPSDAPANVGLFISPVAFSKVFEALLSNSARATEGRADAAIAVEVRWEGDYCKIDIRDNGCGIPCEDWERAFERYYTTKEEGGFGLYYSRGELARFGGKILVVASAPGEGTTIRVILRKS